MFRQLVIAAGALTPEGEKRLARVEALFDVPQPRPGREEALSQKDFP